MDSFSNLIKKAREKSGLFLRQVASEMDIDQAIISKFERGERKPTKEQVLKFCKFYALNQDQAMVAWLSDKLVSEIQDEALAVQALRVAEEKVKRNKTIKKLSPVH